MADSEAIQQEADRLYAILNEEDVPKKVMLSGFVQYSAASKNQVVARIVQTFEPPPQGALLARLLFIRTPDNQRSMRNAFIANLRSPHAEARKFSLLGLKELGHEALPDLALAALRDDADAVVAAAVQELLPAAKQDSQLRAFLQGLCATHRGKQQFHMSVSLLEAHGIVPAPSTD